MNKSWCLVVALLAGCSSVGVSVPIGDAVGVGVSVGSGGTVGGSVGVGVGGVGVGIGGSTRVPRPPQRAASQPSR